MALAAATVLALPPLFDDPHITITREWLTDIQPGRNGAELRANMREAAHRTEIYSVARGEAADIALFWLKWLTASEPLRFKVPLWSDRATTTGTVTAGATVIPVVTTDYDFAAGQEAILWRGETSWEVFSVATTSATALTASATLSTSWAFDGLTRVYPLITAWIDPPSASRVTPVLEVFDLVAREQFGGIAGVDTAVGAEQTAGVSAVSIYGIDAVPIFMFAPNEVTLRAVVRDANSVVLENVPVTWDISVGSQTGDSILAMGWSHLAQFIVGSGLAGRTVRAVAGGVTATAVCSFGGQ